MCMCRILGMGQFLSSRSFSLTLPVYCYYRDGSVTPELPDHCQGWRLRPRHSRPGGESTWKLITFTFVSWLSSGAFRRFSINIPGSSTKIFRTVPWQEGSYNGHDDHLHRQRPFPRNSYGWLNVVSAYPIGGALGQVLSPPFSDTRKSVRAHLIGYCGENVDMECDF